MQSTRAHPCIPQWLLHHHPGTGRLPPTGSRESFAKQGGEGRCGQCEFNGRSVAAWRPRQPACSPRPEAVPSAAARLATGAPELPSPLPRESRPRPSVVDLPEHALKPLRLARRVRVVHKAPSFPARSCAQSRPRRTSVPPSLGAGKSSTMQSPTAHSQLQLFEQTAVESLGQGLGHVRCLCPHRFKFKLLVGPGLQRRLNAPCECLFRVGHFCGPRRRRRLCFRVDGSLCVVGEIEGERKR